MCGIIGAVNFDGSPLDIDDAIMSKNMSLMAYRGPDAQEQWAHAKHPVRLGHLRLSILDTRPEGNQPMHLETDNGVLSMVFNGEVYNYIEIKRQLQIIEVGGVPKYTFQTTTDSEVVLAAYAEWGPDCVHRFNGMFAIAIYNDKHKELILLRDRLGIKPLYYATTTSGVFFASEAKAIRGLLKKKCPLNMGQIKSYMQYGYGIGETTCDEGILRLQPGHLLRLNGNAAAPHRYWTIKRPLKKSRETYVNYATAVTEARQIFFDALRLQLRSDVDLGVFLSGGLDSSAVVAGLYHLNADRQLKTFSVRYDIGDYGTGYDESIFAEMVSKKYGTEHHTFTMTAEDFENYIPEYVRTMDEPVTEAAALSLHFVSELAKKHVSVVLSGEGADEIFGGYDLYLYMETLEILRKIVTPFGAKLIKGLADKLLPTGNKIRKYANMMSVPFEDRYRGLSVYDPTYHKALLTNNILSANNEHEAFARRIMKETRGQELLSRMLEFDTKTWLVDDLLIKADRMSMGSSLELRVPFLDHRMVEFAAALPSHYKIQKGRFKAILKDMLKGELPDDILNRKKLGFPTPLCLMFKGPLQGYIKKRLLEGKKLDHFFEKRAVITLCEEHFSGKVDHHRILWQLVVLAEWIEQNHPEYLK
ncbi:asparagine synthase (glutamine-hydrolyzing) [Alteromonas sp. 14N.309.X.WAT.G.H12]|uniref:asparagine synthase (glutamine-hydrolyzing) n=1 Tax=Alteromonas sp. 14N.309.X.WAT.G.H12 TaxID=3120824 RepID=UPI002FD1C69A